MATITGKVGKRQYFAGGANTFYVKLQQGNRGGVQIVAEGFNIEDATVEILFPGSDEDDPVKQAPVPLEGTGYKIATVGKDASMDAIEISGLDADDYYITIVQL